MKNVPEEVISSWDDVSWNVINTGILAERMKDLERRYGNGNGDLTLFWASFTQISDMLEQSYGELRFLTGQLNDYYVEGVLHPAVAERCRVSAPVALVVNS